MTLSQPDLLVTIDYEERYHGLKSIDSQSFERHESKLQETTPHLLEILDQHDVTATFFVTGILTQEAPEQIEKIHRAGHEIASHGWDHRPVQELSMEQFRDDVRKTRQQLSELLPYSPEGYRAPYFSLPYQNVLEYFRILKNEGYKYDSSLNQFMTPNTSQNPLPRVPLTIEGIQEIPMSTLNIFNFPLPVTGGFWIRLFPYSVTKFLIKKTLESRDEPIMLYVHPWPLEQIDWSLWWNTEGLEKITHFWGRSRFRTKLERLFSEFSTSSIHNYLKENV